MLTLTATQEGYEDGFAILQVKLPVKSDLTIHFSKSYYSASYETVSNTIIPEDPITLISDEPISVTDVNLDGSE